MQFSSDLKLIVFCWSLQNKLTIKVVDSFKAHFSSNSLNPDSISSIIINKK